MIAATTAPERRDASVWAHLAAPLPAGAVQWRQNAPLVARWLEKVIIPDHPDACWEWSAAKTEGYGVIALGRRQLRAHRLSYEWFVGPVPEGMQIDHLCRNRACVNPAHLQAVSQRENILRGEGYSARAARQTHCKRGHPFDAKNTGNDRGKRRCRACHREKERARRNAA